MASIIKLTFAELYRSAFAETDPHIKQQLLQQVQSAIDTWHIEERQGLVKAKPGTEPTADLQSLAS